MNADDIRCSNDLKLFEQLKAHRDVARVNEQLEKMAEDNATLKVRRHLLATSVRLSERMAPNVHALTARCIDTLALDIPVELYVFASPQYNAMCFKPEDGRLFVMFASSLLENFSDDELGFVIGHELGHHVYRHHDIPIGYILRGRSKPNARLALELFAWSRYAEISADRAGAHCTEELSSVAEALFKLASGLSGQSIQFSLDDFLRQVDEMQLHDGEPGQGAPKEDWFSTHPFSPLRVKALQHYYKSELKIPGGTAKEDLEVAVQALMSLMEPSYLEGRTTVAESMRRALFAGALAVANADGVISDAEIEVFEQFFGSGSFNDRIDIEKTVAELDSRLEQVQDEASSSQRTQLLRDLCLIAGAEGQQGEAERAVLDAVADKLDLPRRLVCQTLDKDIELD
ncbi:MAG: M48 family metallopeptidase [Pseudomonadota bacterium]